uniref:Uncharacterized protein n=1 Tax=Schizaphis graminum TaxID=13262 RepID=A0A2S2N7H3_SCHGA
MLAAAPAGQPVGTDHEVFIRRRRKTRPTKSKTKNARWPPLTQKNQLRSSLITRRRQQQRMTAMPMIIILQLLLINRATPMGGRQSYDYDNCLKKILGRIGNATAVARYRTTS